MKKDINLKTNAKQKTMLLVLLALIFILASGSIIVVNAVEYRSVRINYLFANGESASDPYVAVFEKDASVNIDVTNPTISGYKAVTSLDESEQQPALTTHVECELNDDLTMEVYYVPDVVPYKVKYFMQNVYDDDYTANLTLADSYYEKSGLTGTFPDELSEISFDGFTKLYHKPDFIAADGSTEFELYYTRNYYLINFDLNGGHGVEPVYAKYQSVYNIAEPAKKGYVFEGWVLSDKDGNYVDEEGNILTDEQARDAADPFTSGIVPDHNVNYKAYWSAGETFYSIVYWVEEADSTNYSDVASLDVYHYKNGNAVMTGDTISVDDTNTVPDFFTDYNLNPQKVQRDSQGNVILDSDLRPTYLTSADLEGYEEGDPIYPIDEYDHEIDFPEMSPGEREELNGKWRYFEIDTEKTISSMTVSGDGSTRINIYYKRKPITQRFFFARSYIDENNNVRYQVPGWTRAFSTKEGTLNNHLSDNWGRPTHWQELNGSLPEYADEYKTKLDANTHTYEANGYTYYYYELKTEYYSNMRDNWLSDAFKPYEITNTTLHDYHAGDYARFGAWSAEWGTPYAMEHDNKTVKAIYEKLDDQLLYKESYLDLGYVDDPLVLNYLSFWTNAKNANWNYKNAVYNFTYQNYVELLPSEYNADGTWNGTGGYTSVIAVHYDVESGSQVINAQKKLYGLLPKNIIETYDGAAEYKNVNTRDKDVKDKQTATSLTGFALLESEINKVTSAQVVYGTDTGDDIDLKKQNPVCKWYAKDEFDENHHADIKFFYRRRYYSLEFMNNNVHENSAAHTRNIYYQDTINRTGIRGNWVYFEPEYPDEDMRDYYYFDGWYYDEDHTRKVPIIENDTAYADNAHPEGRTHFADNDFKMPPDDVTLFAKWNLVTETVNFYNDYDAYTTGADPISSPVVEYNSMILTQDIPTTNPDDNRPDLTPISDGAIFIGWFYIDETGTERRFEPEEIPVVKEMNLYAKWLTEETANYRVDYVEKGTNTKVADSDTGFAYVSSTKSFRAKVNNELYEPYRPQENQNNWFPVVSSHSILIKSNSVDDNLYRFEYVKKDHVWYKVRYLDAATLQPLFDEEEKYTTYQLVSEQYKSKKGYIPDMLIKTLEPAASTNDNDEEAKAEELNMNVITFLYTKNDTQAMVRIEHMLQNVDGDPNNKMDYSPHRVERITKQINSTIDMDADVYSTAIATELMNSHYDINTDLTEVNDVLYTGQTITVDGNLLVIRVYYMRSKYPYKVECVDIDRDDLPEGVLESTVYSDPEDLQPLGAVVSITPKSPLVIGDDTYLPISSAAQSLTIYHEEFDDPNHPNPQTNVKTIYYKKQTSVQLNYEIVCEGAIPGDLQLSQNREIVKLQTDIKGCTATDYSGVDGRYTFLGWYRTREAKTEYFITSEQPYIPTLPNNDTTYYAIFKMNSAPYTLNYVYQGREGGNDGSYIGDDAETDEKVYTVNLVLDSEQWDDDLLPISSVLVENAPAVDDLYKDCVWTFTDEHMTFDKATHTVTITAVQTAKRCSVEFRYQGETLDVQRIPINSLVMPDGAFVEAPESDGDNSFNCWIVTDKDCPIEFDSENKPTVYKEIARCYSREFNLRVTGNYIVTAYYETEAHALYINEPEYSRQKYTDDNGNTVDKLYADFILAYMDESGLLLNPKYNNHIDEDGNDISEYLQTGLIMEYDSSIRLSKEDAAGATLSDEEKADANALYAAGDVLSAENAKALVQGSFTPEGTRRYVNYTIKNSSYNNKNRIDKSISFGNSYAARHLVMRAYYYVYNTKDDSIEITDPVYFYLYDIGNSVSSVSQE